MNRNRQVARFLLLLSVGSSHHFLSSIFYKLVIGKISGDIAYHTLMKYNASKWLTGTWKIRAEPKLGPCPEKWMPLLPEGSSDYALLQKCVSHIDVTSLQPKVETLNDAINACSHLFDNASTTATIFRPEDKRELKSFLALASKEELEGMIDIFVEGKIPYDHSGNDMRQLGEAIINPIENAADRHCAWNRQKGEIQYKSCSSFTTLWCQYKAKPVMTNAPCNGWFKADQGSHVNCYFVYRYRTAARNARDVCKLNKAQLVTIDNIAEWSYLTRLAKALAPKTRYRSLMLGYTRCSTESSEWRTLENDIISKFLPFPNATSENDEQCCLELSIDSKFDCKKYFYYF
uniref:C-type lectin domain-containing protein n=1 Tax=Elaeophora elaphi TaxID=1147741 RepID=A0A0R3RVR7_9BILA